jgi:hypothetical protein
VQQRCGLAAGPRRAAVERRERRVCALDVERRAQLAEGLRGLGQTLGGAFGLRLRVGAAEFVAGAGAAVAVAERLEDRDAAPEVLRGARGVALGQRVVGRIAQRLRLGGAIARRRPGERSPGARLRRARRRAGAGCPSRTR